MYRSLVLAWPLPLFSELFNTFAEFLDGFPKIDTDFSMFLGVVYMWRPTPGDLSLQQVKHLYLQYLKRFRIRVRSSHIVVISRHDLIGQLSAQISALNMCVCLYTIRRISTSSSQPQPEQGLRMIEAIVWEVENSTLTKPLNMGIQTFGFRSIKYVLPKYLNIQHYHCQFVQLFFKMVKHPIIL